MTLAVCVFCGSSAGKHPAFAEASARFGREIGRRGMTLVYGGGRVGLMGVVADAALAAGARVVGVIPRFLCREEVVHPGIDEQIVVDDLFTRKRIMIERADAFVALPGGLGTFDEILEVIAWRQLGQLHSPIGVLDVAAYFQPWLEGLRHAATNGFLRDGDVAHLIIETQPEQMLSRLVEATHKRP